MVLLLPGGAAAHTKLSSSAPASGTTVEGVEAFELHFTEPVEPAASHLWLTDSSGSVELPGATHVGDDGASLRIPAPELGDGAYQLGYHVLTRDGHSTSGQISFEVAQPTSAGVRATAEAGLADTTTQERPNGTIIVEGSGGVRPSDVHDPGEGGHRNEPPLDMLARGLLDASLATLVGGLAFVTAIWPKGARLARTRQVLWAAALVAALASFELVAVQHAAVAGFNALEGLAPWRQWEALGFRFGRIAAARVVLLAASAVLTAWLTRGRQRSSVWAASATAVALGLAETVALVGHTGDRGLFNDAARLLHVVALSIWIGGLVMLFVVVLPRRRADELADVLPRFSRMASTAVALLIAGGLALAIDLVGAARAVPTTPYGRVLAAKVAVVALVLGAASASRRHVRASLANPEPQVSGSVTRSISLWVGTELCLVVLVLGLTAALVAEAPPG